MYNTTVTIGRQFGSGGKEIGERLSKELDMKFYDKELLQALAKENGISDKILNAYDEKPTNSFLYSLVSNPHGFVFNNDFKPIELEVFLAQSELIKKIADESPCIIVGRCSDYILEDKQNNINIFIYAKKEFRIERIKKLYNIDNIKAEKMIDKNDKDRASYYNYYTNKKWGYASNYNLCIDSSMLGIDKCIGFIKTFIELMSNQ